ncbi:hypothetical protein PTKIN_Ptkin13bG0100200 [Pterospermum kingtungense]
MDLLERSMKKTKTIVDGMESQSVEMVIETMPSNNMMTGKSFKDTLLGKDGDDGALWRPKSEFEMVAIDNDYFLAKISSVDDYNFAKVSGHRQDNYPQILHANVGEEDTVAGEGGLNKATEVNPKIMENFGPWILVSHKIRRRSKKQSGHEEYGNVHEKRIVNIQGNNNVQNTRERQTRFALLTLDINIDEGLDNLGWKRRLMKLIFHPTGLLVEGGSRIVRTVVVNVKDGDNMGTSSPFSEHIGKEHHQDPLISRKGQEIDAMEEDSVKDTLVGESYLRMDMEMVSEPCPI